MKFLVLAGTQDGRTIGEELAKTGHEVVLSTLTEYGANLAQAQGLKARFGAFERESLRQFLKHESIQAIVDATHPYAQVIQKLARSLGSELNLPYFRWERPGTVFEDNPLIRWALDIEEASRIAAASGEKILLTTGSNALPEWVSMPCLKDKRLYVRVLPTSAVLVRCESLGLTPGQIIAAQGPFTKEFNLALIRQFQIDVVVTKDSGKSGGTREKIEACLEAGIPLVMLKRPERTGEGLELLEFIKKLEEKLCQPPLFS
ncbi:precorrin-6A reductase [Paradesulfitobacterium ferrireducens]|uniref:precorrin-6A reductase n=1 Tax=Paradesulfitobacterium ferrireducens TaxID=2816476 RepID=UPI001A8BFDB3|nr:precorrin-6A reductase [Paradesulfitobacterium ferrireducens]